MQTISVATGSLDSQKACSFDGCKGNIEISLLYANWIHVLPGGSVIGNSNAVLSYGLSTPILMDAFTTDM